MGTLDLVLVRFCLRDVSLQYACKNCTSAHSVLVCFRSNKQECPASVFVSGTVEPDALIVTKVNIEHTCSVRQHFDWCHKVEMNVPDEASQTVDTPFLFDVQDTGAAPLLQDTKTANITLNDMSNWYQQIQHSDDAQDEMQVTAATAMLLEVYFDVTACWKQIIHRQLHRVTGDLE